MSTTHRLHVQEDMDGSPNSTVNNHGSKEERLHGKPVPHDPAGATWFLLLALAEGQQRVATQSQASVAAITTTASSLGKGSTSNLLNPRTHVARGVRGEEIAHTLGLRIHYKKWLQRTRAMTGGDACSTRAHSGSKLSQGGTGDTTISCCPTSDNAPLLFFPVHCRQVRLKTRELWHHHLLLLRADRPGVKKRRYKGVSINPCCLHPI